MSQQIRITANGRNFQQAVKLLKKRGGQFDGQSWTLPAGSIDADNCRTWGLEIVSESREHDAGLKVDFQPEHTLGM